MPAEALALYRRTVPSAWIDYNGHMNVAYYVLAFDEATDAMLDHLGMDAAYREQSGCSVFVLETHINYLRELTEGETLAVTTQLLDADSKRLHYFHQMWAADGGLVATTELLLMHMDMTARRGAPFSQDAQQAIAQLLDQHRQLPRPEQAGRVIGIRRR